MWNWSTISQTFPGVFFRTFSQDFHKVLLTKRTLLLHSTTSTRGSTACCAAQCCLGWSKGRHCLMFLDVQASRRRQDGDRRRGRRRTRRDQDQDAKAASKEPHVPHQLRQPAASSWRRQTRYQASDIFLSLVGKVLKQSLLIHSAQQQPQSVLTPWRKEVSLLFDHNSGSGGRETTLCVVYNLA